MTRELDAHNDSVKHRLLRRGKDAPQRGSASVRRQLEAKLGKGRVGDMIGRMRRMSDDAK